MCFYIGIEDLAANALIELMTRKDLRVVTYDELESYGNAVIDVLNEKGEKAVLILSRDSTNAMFRNYSDFFEEIETQNGLGISLRQGKDVDDLIDRFRGYLSWDVLLALIDDKSVKELGVSA